ncbi:hypothetical protein pdam_00021923 [Pocillopora damicornis]|uniref:Uncharacterized protein n=1 Tax=Pocillopora damicornis TaxID=46731 RepID=A0A3M6UIG2_POCDA|nr:hypothetical protein pdam_00021923 [Pocillopora damicornis]
MSIFDLYSKCEASEKISMSSSDNNQAKRMSYFLPRLKFNECLLRPCVFPLLSYLFLHNLCPQASTSAALEAMYVT